MTDLDLKELDRLEREATEQPWEVGWERDKEHKPPVRAEAIGPLAADHDHWSGWTIGDEADACLVVAARNQLRPLLDLVDALGEKLEDAATAVHQERAHEGRFWDCPHWGCSSANVIIKTYRRTKGE